MATQKHATKSVKSRPAKKARANQGAEVSVPLAIRAKEERTLKRKSKRSARQVIVALDDERVGLVAGVPDEGQIEEAIGALSPGDNSAWQEVRVLLAKHLGSAAAARLWLVTASPGFETTPLDEIRKGKARPLLTMLESQWGTSPTYA